MRAIQIEAFVDPAEVLKLVDIPEPPAPSDNEVLIGVEFAPVNVNDFYVVRGTFPFLPALPGPVGNEGVGRVLAVGSGVSNVAVGDRVLVPLYSFSWREQLVVPAAGLFPLPEKADPQQLAMLGINPPTAALLISEHADLEPGDWIVQNAANSGVGRSVIAIAKARGLRTINLVRREELVAELEAIGGDVVVVANGDTVEKVKKAVGDGRVPLGLDAVGGIATNMLADIVTDRAHIVAYALMSEEPAAVGTLTLIFKRTIIQGFFLNHPEMLPRIDAALHEAAALIAAGDIHVPVAAVYPMSAIQDAVAHVNNGGKVLLDMTASG